MYKELPPWPPAVISMIWFKNKFGNAPIDLKKG